MKPIKKIGHRIWSKTPFFRMKKQLSPQEMKLAIQGKHKAIKVNPETKEFVEEKLRQGVFVDKVRVIRIWGPNGKRKEFVRVRHGFPETRVGGIKKSNDYKVIPTRYYQMQFDERGNKEKKYR